MKRVLYIIVVFLAIICGLLIKKAIETERKYEAAVANIKAYDLELSKAKQKSVAYQLTISQLEYFQDSVIKELEDTRKELKIKAKNLKAMQAVSSSFTKKDTVVFRDTLFLNPYLDVDTTINDEWYSVQIGLKYPSTIAVSPCFVSKKHILVSTRKETVNPPKKFFLLRWFQKKHQVIQVDVVEKNPYVENETSKYIEIIK